MSQRILFYLHELAGQPTLDDQRAALERYAGESLVPRGYALHGLYTEETNSAHLVDRPMGRRLHRDADNGSVVASVAPQVLWHTQFDMFHTVDNWHKRKISVVLLSLPLDTTTESGKSAYLACRSMWEWHRHIKANMLAGYGRKTKTPHGYKRVIRGKDKQHVLIRDDYERQMGDYFITWHDMGYSWAEIENHLLASNIKTPRGGQWRADAIRYMYDAEVELRKQEAMGTAPPVWEEEKE